MSGGPWNDGAERAIEEAQLSRNARGGERIERHWTFEAGRAEYFEIILRE